MVASWTPCVASLTVSLLGHRVAATRRRSSTSWSSGTLTWKARISTVALYGSLSTCAVASCVMVVSFLSVEFFLEVRFACIQEWQGRQRQKDQQVPAHQVDDIGSTLMILLA